MAKKRQHKINEEIYATQVRVTGEGIESTVMSKWDAIKLAEGLEKDVILISENANPPVVKIEDYNKFLYKQHQKEKENKSNSQKSELK